MTCYYGESSRTIYERYKKHKDGERSNNKDNPLWKHDVLSHDGIMQEYTVKVLEKHRDPMRRQVTEKVILENRMKTQKLMNSKNEWGGAPLPRVTIGCNDEFEKNLVDKEISNMEDQIKAENLGKNKRCRTGNNSNGMPIPTYVGSSCNNNNGMSIPTYVGNSGVRRNMSKIRKISQNIDIRTSLIKCNQTHLLAPLSD